MFHHIWADGPYEVALLLKEQSLVQRNIEDNYFPALDKDKTVALSLDYGGKKKPSAKVANAYIPTLLKAIDSLSIKVIYCADGEYFKKLTKLTKAEPSLGYVVDCAWKGYEDIKVIYGINYQSLFYDPKNKDKLALSLKTLQDHMSGSYTAIGSDIIKHSEYYDDVPSIKKFLKKLHGYPELTCDLETFSLFFGDAGIGTVGFAWNQHEGGVICCDYVDNAPLSKMHELMDIKPVGTPGVREDNEEVRALLKQFFTEYKGKLIWHNAGYDLKILVYTLWMKDYLDYDGMVKGVEIVTNNFDDTKLLTYLATNSCAGNKLSLKDQAHEFAGNYAEEDINDIRLIKKDKLMKYNLVDCLSTWYVYNKHNDTVDVDDQREIYDTLFKPAAKQILQMELVGMPIHMPSVHKANNRLTRLHDTYYGFLQRKLEEMGYLKIRRQEEVHIYNTTRKVKRKTENDFLDLELNPGSPKQLQELLYTHWGFPVLDFTDTKQPATGTKTLKKLKEHTDDPDKIMVIRCLIHLSKVDKIISAFMPNFLNATPVSDGTHRLYGGFNLGGTVSGRLSSSKPNLQQIPSGSTYAKLIKNCFRAPQGQLFVGADYNSLEDYVSALTTRDPNKIKVYEDGYCGHCLRAYYYFKDQMPDWMTETPQDINQIKDEKIFGNLRQKSKAPTFALTYQGTFTTLMNNCGFSRDEAKSIEDSYHEMYQVSDKWVQDRLQQANKDGYVTVAYGLRVRTPLIRNVVWGAPRMPKEAAAEGRTAGNALGQSYGLVNSKAASMLQERINASEYRGRIHISALIHDACYLMLPDEVGAVEWLNNNLIECMESHGLPELDWHPTVKIGAELDIFYPSWKEAINLKNNLTKKEILNVVGR